MSVNPDLLLTGATALVSACLGAGGVAPILTRIHAAKRQQYLDQYKAMDKMFQSMQARIDLVERAERECLQLKDELLREIGDLRAQVAALQVHVDRKR